MSTDSSNSGSVGFLGLLGLLFIGLKLGGFIDWSWWYVTLPLWGVAALVLAVGAVLLVGWLLTQLFGALRGK